VKPRGNTDLPPRIAASDYARAHLDLVTSRSRVRSDAPLLNQRAAAETFALSAMQFRETFISQLTLDRGSRARSRSRIPRAVRGKEKNRFRRWWQPRQRRRERAALLIRPRCASMAPDILVGSVSSPSPPFGGLREREKEREKQRKKVS